MRNDVLLTAFAFGVITGLRSLRGIAALAVEQEDDTRGWLRSHPYWKGRRKQPIADALRSPLLTNALRGGALAEGIADKSDEMPDRIDPVPLAGRVVIGALVGAAVAELTGEDKAGPAAAGAVGALSGAYGAWYARRWITTNYDVDDKYVGMAEDAIAFGASKLLAKQLI